MPFADLAGPIPDGLTTPEFVLRPLVAADVELDYAAVMESRVELRPWEQTGWPADDFTLADDLVDVESLEQRHLERRSFTYTVTTPGGTECLGCVYVMPPDARSFTSAEISPVGDRRWTDYRAAIYFWVRTSRLSSGLDARLFDALRDWFARGWPLAPHLFVTNEQCPRQVELIESAGLLRRFVIQGTGQPGAYLAFEQLSSLSVEAP